MLTGDEVTDLIQRWMTDRGTKVRYRDRKEKEQQYIRQCLQKGWVDDRYPETDCQEIRDIRHQTWDAAVQNQHGMSDEEIELEYQDMEADRKLDYLERRIREQDQEILDSEKRANDHHENFNRTLEHYEKKYSRALKMFD